MRAVGLKVLKNKLSEYVRLAASGEMILVTDREKVVAELGPPETARSPAVADAVVTYFKQKQIWSDFFSQSVFCYTTTTQYFFPN